MPPALSNDSPVVGSPVSVSNGTWTGYPAPTFTYRWQDCAGGHCTPISGATQQDYTPVTSDVGQDLEAIVTATNSAGQASADSE